MFDLLKYNNIASRSESKILCISCERGYLLYDNLDLQSSDLIIKNINMDLEIVYHQHNKFGLIIPFIYDTLSCPYCYFSILKSDKDFIDPLDFNKNDLKLHAENRLELAKQLFPEIVLKDPLTIEHSLLIYMNSILSYEYANHSLFKSLRQGMVSMRCFWLLKHFMAYYKIENLNLLKNYFFNYAIKNYEKVFNIYIKKPNPIIFKNYHCGPDNYNWSLNGIFYLNAYFYFIQSFNQKLDLNQKLTLLNKSLSILNHLFDLLEKERVSKSIVLLKRYRMLLDEKIKKNIIELKKV